MGDNHVHGVGARVERGAAVVVLAVGASRGGEVQDDASAHCRLVVHIIFRFSGFRCVKWFRVFAKTQIVTNLF